MSKLTPEQFIDNVCIKNHILQRISIEITYRCNERCRHCYVFDEKKISAEELSVDQYYTLFDDLRKMETLHITLTGGDPSQRKDFTEILRGAVERGFAVSIFTNGIGYTDETLEEIIRIRPASISFSIYSGIAEEHDDITRVKGSLKKTLATLKKVKDAGINVSVKTPVMLPTFKGFSAVQDLCEKFNVRHEISYFICATNHGNVSPAKLRLNDVEKYKHIIRLVQRHKKENYEFQPRDIHDAVCGAGRLSLSVNPYGEVFPCNSFHYPLGNVKNMSISEIWNGDALRKIYDLRFEQLGDVCVKCDYRDDCLYCMGSTLAENGSIFIPIKEICKIARATHEVRIEESRF